MLYVCLHLNVNICNIILHYLSVLLGILHKKIGFTWTVIVPSQKKLTCHKLMFYSLNQIVSNFSYFKLWLFDLTVQWVFKVSCNLLNERCKKMFSLPTFHKRAGGEIELIRVTKIVETWYSVNLQYVVHYYSSML